MVLLSQVVLVVLPGRGHVGLVMWLVDESKTEQERDAVGSRVFLVLTSI